MDYDAIIIGGGPAGLTAGCRLAQSGYSVLVLEKDSFGGQLMKVEWLVGHSGSSQQIAGARLGAELADNATASGVMLKQDEVIEVESYASCKSVTCASGESYTCSVVIVASGLRYKKLGAPNEARLTGRGVIDCALCDGGLYRERVVVVCGGGNAGIRGALLLAKYASKVHIVEAQPELSADIRLQMRALAEPKLAIRCGAKAIDILGDDGVASVRIEDVASGAHELIDAYGVLVNVGFEPSTEYLEHLLSLDSAGYVETTSDTSQPELPGIFLTGDVKRGSPRSVAWAIEDGQATALSVEAFLKALTLIG